MVGGVAVGGGAPVSIQSMTNTRTEDVGATLSQIARLTDAGCDIVRVAVPNMKAARAFREIKAGSPLPVVADIHFDYKLALAALEAGADKIRINPGNIGSEDKLRAVAEACKARGVPIRVGINGGSLEADILEKAGGPTAAAMVESAVRNVDLLRKFDFEDICISLKASDVITTVEACRLAAQCLDYPQHLGVTEAGTAYSGIIRSGVGIGTLLMEGIGDTVRVSLTADPAEEIAAGIEILKAAGLRRGGIRLISCPSCGRCGIDLIGTAKMVEHLLGDVRRDITVAVMGCVVNGPGEAKGADYGIAGGDQEGVLFKKGRVVGKARAEHLASALLELIQNDNPESEN